MKSIREKNSGPFYVVFIATLLVVFSPTDLIPRVFGEDDLVDEIITFQEFKSRLDGYFKSVRRNGSLYEYSSSQNSGERCQIAFDGGREYITTIRDGIYQRYMVYGKGDFLYFSFSKGREVRDYGNVLSILDISHKNRLIVSSSPAFAFLGKLNIDELEILDFDDLLAPLRTVSVEKGYSDGGRTIDYVGEGENFTVMISIDTDHGNALKSLTLKDFVHNEDSSNYNPDFIDYQIFVEDYLLYKGRYIPTTITETSHYQEVRAQNASKKKGTENEEKITVEAKTTFNLTHYKWGHNQIAGRRIFFKELEKIPNGTDVYLRDDYDHLYVWKDATIYQRDLKNKELLTVVKRWDRSFLPIPGTPRFHIFSIGLFLILVSIGWKWSNRPYRPRSKSRVPPEELSHDEGNENEDSKGAKNEDSE